MVKCAEIVSCSCQRFVIGSVELESNNVFHVANSNPSTASPMSREECNADAHSDARLILHMRFAYRRSFFSFSCPNVVALSFHRVASLKVLGDVCRKLLLTF